VELYLHSPNTPSWRGAQLKHRDFTFICPNQGGYYGQGMQHGWEFEKYKHNFGRKTCVEDHVGDLGIGMRLIMKWILK
jgi:hypothetical protein